MLEIGFGNGEQLLFAAEREPERDFIGVEVHGPGVGRLLNMLAADGLDGMRVFEAHAQEVDLVILDRTMPGRDGLELLADIRQRRPELPAIISSGYADSTGSQKLSTLGIDGILQKPWSPAELVHLVGELGLPASTPKRDATRTTQAS